MRSILRQDRLTNPIHYPRLFYWTAVDGEGNIGLPLIPRAKGGDTNNETWGNHYPYCHLSGVSYALGFGSIGRLVVRIKLVEIPAILDIFLKAVRHVGPRR